MANLKRSAIPARRERGQSLVEMAVSLPVILLLLMGTADFGMAIFSYTILRDAAQEGALYGSFDPANRAGIERRARGISPHTPESPFYSPVDLTNPDLVKVSIKTAGGACQEISAGRSNDIEVSVSYDYPMLTPLMQQIIGSGSILLSAKATNVILQPPCP